MTWQSKIIVSDTKLKKYRHWSLELHSPGYRAVVVNFIDHTTSVPGGKNDKTFNNEQTDYQPIKKIS